MVVSLTEDIRPLTDLKRHTERLRKQVHKTGRPVIFTVNGRADVVLLDAKTYERQMRASNLAKLLAPAEEDIAAGRTRETGEFFREFKDAHKIPD